MMTCPVLAGESGIGANFVTVGLRQSTGFFRRKWPSINENGIVTGKLDLLFAHAASSRKEPRSAAKWTEGQ